MLFGELAKMAALAEHYELHCSEKPDTTLAEFIWLHYFDSAHQNDTSHNHHDLPFHHHHSGFAVAPSACCSLPETLQDWVLGLPDSNESVNNADFYYHRFIPAGFVGNLFQPPKA